MRQMKGEIPKGNFLVYDGILGKQETNLQTGFILMGILTFLQDGYICWIWSVQEKICPRTETQLYKKTRRQCRCECNTRVHRPSKGTAAEF